MSKLTDNLAALESYIEMMKSSSSDLVISYFITLHNFLILEGEFKEDVIKAGKELNKHLDLTPVDSPKKVVDIFKELYDVNHPIRNNVETFDNIEPIRQYLKKYPSLYQPSLNKKIRNS